MLSLKKRFHNYNIKKKLIIVMVLTSAVMLFLSMAGTTLEDLRQARAGLAEQAETLGEMLAFNSSSALEFLDESAAEKTLEALKAEHSVAASAVYDAEGNLFASYPQDLAPGMIPKTVNGKDGNVWLSSFMENYTPIKYESETLGTVYLKFDLQYLYQELVDRIIIGAIIFLGLCLLTLYVVSKAQTLVSQPILSLVEVADVVSTKHDYSMRAEKLGNDEIGRLTDSFNNMLQTISKNEADLKEYQEHLEEQVETRTQELKDSEERTRVILETAPDGILTVDAEGKILSFNAAAGAMFGAQLHEAEHVPFLDLVSADDKNQAEGLFNHSRKPEDNVLELKLKGKDGDDFPASLSYSEVTQGNQLQYTVILRDITSFYEAQAALQLGLEQAEAASQAKSDFLANMSHEIRTPLNGIIGMTNFALETNLTAQQQDFLDTVKDSADNLLEILNDILDFSKIEADRLDIEHVNFNLRDIVEGTVRTLQSKFVFSDVEFLCRFAQDLPYNVVGDPVRIRQVLINLVGNAQKFTRKGEVLLSISVKGDSEKQLCFDVKDTGIGIPEDKQLLIFEAFSQADTSTTRHFGGTGLGLTISAKLASLMNGTLDVTSVEGEGSTFSLVIPLEVAPGEQKRTIPAGLESLKGKHILGVDDNRINREILQELVSRYLDMTIEVAESGPEALEMLEEKKKNGEMYDLIISDHQMPAMDGVEFITRAKDLLAPVSIPVIVLSSLDRINMQELGFEVGISTWLMKPILPTTLINSLQEVFGLSVPASTGDKKLEIKCKPTIEYAKQNTPPLNILVAEDNRVNQKLIKRLLEKYGHDVLIADNGKDAFDVLNDLGHFDADKQADGEKIDLVFMDIQMPVMGGVEATQLIREHEKKVGAHLPIVALTAHALKGHREEYLNSGLDSYLTKPVDTEKLLILIQQYTPQEKLQALTSELPNYEEDGSKPTVAGAIPSGILRDKESLLRSVGGNHELLMEIILQLYATLEARESSRT